LYPHIWACDAAQTTSLSQLDYNIDNRETGMETTE